MPNIDWGAIKAEYVTGKDSYAKLGEKYGLLRNTVQRKGTAEGWPELRVAYREEALSKAIETAKDEEADRLHNLIVAAETLQDVIIKALEDKEQFNRYLIQDEIYDPKVDAAVKTTKERIYKKIDTKAIKDLTGAIKDLTYSVRNLCNLPTQAERESQRIASERLNMDKAKIDMNDDSNKRIVIQLGDLEDYAQ